jgi:hypothetical protein
MGEEFTVTRGAQARAGRPFIAFIMISLLVGYLALQAARLAWRGSLELSGAPTGQATVFVVDWLLLVGLLVVLLRMLAPFWQLLRASRSPDDVVLALDAHGVHMRDGGCAISAPWTSLSAVQVGRGDGHDFRMRVVASGPVEVSRDAIGRLMARRLRRQGVSLRFTDGSPSRAELVAAIARFSGDQFAVAVPAPRKPADSAARVA